MRAAIITILTVLGLDQISKVWVKLNMWQGEQFPVFHDWFYIHFLENPGMAFGLEFGGEWGKVALSLFRIVAVFLIARYLLRFIRAGFHTGFIISASMVLAGAMGNIIDSAVYGLIFSESPPIPDFHAELFPSDGGYAPFLMGKVVDMLYFPLFSFDWPEWMPWIGGDHFEFFRPVFNIADASISVGLGLILVFQKRFFGEHGGLEQVLNGGHDTVQEEMEDEEGEQLEGHSTDIN